MFGLDPFSRPVAIAEMLLLLLFAAIIGWLLARLILNGRVTALQAEIAEKENELEECRRRKVNKPTPVAVSTPPPSRPVEVPAAEPVTTSMPVVPVMGAPVLDVPIEVAPIVSVADVPMTDVPIAPVAPTVTTPPPALTGNSEDAVLNRIASRAGEINFDRIGRASASEADDLKDIVGVGPFLERKLHSLGIYTFRQIANFTQEDIKKVNDIIEFFPGRIERDNWVSQSKTFHERKHGTRNVA